MALVEASDRESNGARPGSTGPASAETSAGYGAGWGCTGHKAGSGDPLDSGRQKPITSGSSSGDGCPSSSGREGPTGLVPEAGGDVEAGAAQLSTQPPVSGRCSADLMPETKLEVRKCCYSPQLVALEESWILAGLRSTAEAEGALGAESSSSDHIPARKEASNE